MALTLTELENYDLRDAVVHRRSASIDSTLHEVYEQLNKYNVEFIAVLDGERLAGICSRDRVNLLLSHRYGRSLYLRHTLRMDHVEPETRTVAGTPLAQVFEPVFMRERRYLFDDVVLVDGEGRYLGMIPMNSMIQLQHSYFTAQLDAVRRQREELDSKNRQNEQEMIFARDLQMSFLPPVSRNGHGPGLHYTMRFEPADSLSGDFMQILDAGPGALGILICDVMGHGVRSALITALIRGLVERLPRFHARPGELLTQINRDLSGLLNQPGAFMFVTACCFVCDSKTGRTIYSNAGHHPPLRVRGRGGVEKILSEGGGQPALGIVPDLVYETFSCDLKRGDRFLLFTDGLTEAMNRTGEEFGEKRLTAVMSSHREHSTERFLDAVIGHAQDFIHPRTFDDDVCLVGVEYR